MAIVPKEGGDMKAWYEMSESINGIPVTRYVASWYIAGGKQNIHAVREWLRSLPANLNFRNLLRSSDIYQEG